MSREVERPQSFPLILFFCWLSCRRGKWLSVRSVTSPCASLSVPAEDTAVRSEAFVSDFKTFFMVIWQFIVNAFQLLLKGGQWASQLGDKIPQPVVATIVHYLLLIVFVGGIAIGVGFLIFLGASKVFEFYTEDYADTMSLAVFLISLAVSVYFAEPIRAVIPINLLLLLILVHIVYVLIRWYVKGCMRSRGYY